MHSWILLVVRSIRWTAITTSRQLTNSQFPAGIFHHEMLFAYNTPIYDKWQCAQFAYTSRTTKSSERTPECCTFSVGCRNYYCRVHEKAKFSISYSVVPFFFIISSFTFPWFLMTWCRTAEGNFFVHVFLPFYNLSVMSCLVVVICSQQSQLTESLSFQHRHTLHMEHCRKKVK